MGILIIIFKSQPFVASSLTVPIRWAFRPLPFFLSFPFFSGVTERNRRDGPCARADTLLAVQTSAWLRHPRLKLRPGRCC